MAYTPTTWKDRVVEHPRTYTIQDNGDGTITLTPAPGTVYEPGTPVSAPNMNKIEQGLVDAHAHIARTDNPHAVTKAQVGLGNVQNYGIASQAQAEAGSANNVYMTPLSTKQYVDTRLLNNLKFRLNSGSLEYNDGGTWRPVSANKVSVVSNTERKSFPTERVSNGGLQYVLAAKFIPEATGEIKVSFEAKREGDASSYFYVFNSSISSFSRKNESFDYLTPEGTVLSVTPSPLLQIGGNINSSNYSSFSDSISIYSLQPVYFFIRGNTDTTAYVRNIKIYYDVIYS
jgi:hypothetical protein